MGANLSETCFLESFSEKNFTKRVTGWNVDSWLGYFEANWCFYMTFIDIDLSESHHKTAYRPTFYEKSPDNFHHSLILKN